MRNKSLVCLFSLTHKTGNRAFRQTFSSFAIALQLEFIEDNFKMMSITNEIKCYISFVLKDRHQHKNYLHQHESKSKFTSFNIDDITSNIHFTS